MTKLLLSLCVLVLALFVASLLVGPADIGVMQSLSALFATEQTPVSQVMQQIRLPRAILGVMVGLSLGLAGAALQGLLRNPLAEPGVIGVSAASALGAVLALQTGFAVATSLALPLSALVGAAVAVVLILLLAGRHGSSITLILAGVAISALSTAMTSLVLNLSPNPFAASEIMFWMMGSLADRSFDHVSLVSPVMVVGWLLLLSTVKSLNALSLGEDVASSLGVRLSLTRWSILIGAAAAVGASTAVAGAIGFIGLVVPHVLRRWVGHQPGALLPASALGGAALLLAADIAVRVVLPGKDLKLGVVMAIIGAPLFLHLIIRTRRGQL